MKPFHDAFQYSRKLRNRLHRWAFTSRHGCYAEKSACRHLRKRSRWVKCVRCPKFKHAEIFDGTHGRYTVHIKRCVAMRSRNRTMFASRHFTMSRSLQFAHKCVKIAYKTDVQRNCRRRHTTRNCSQQLDIWYEPGSRTIYHTPFVKPQRGEKLYELKKRGEGSTSARSFHEHIHRTRLACAVQPLLLQCQHSRGDQSGESYFLLGCALLCRNRSLLLCCAASACRDLPHFA